MLKLLIKGGPLMLPIFVCSVISITIIIERFYRFFVLRPRKRLSISRVKSLLKNGNLQDAKDICETIGGCVSRILGKGIGLWERPFEKKEKMLSIEGSRLLRVLEKNLRGLAIIGNITPLLGLLGTVTGLIKAFMKIQELGGRVDASVLAGGIWEALLTTAAGLSVAIPTLVFYHYFEGKADNYAMLMKDAAEEILELRSEGS